MKTESASVDHFAGLQEIADTITRLREDKAALLKLLTRLHHDVFFHGIQEHDRRRADAFLTLMRTMSESRILIQKIEGAL